MTFRTLPLTTRNTLPRKGRKPNKKYSSVAGVAVFTLILNVTHPVRKARSLWQETRVGPPAIAPPGPLAPAEPPSGRTIQSFKVSKSLLEENCECYPVFDVVQQFIQCFSQTMSYQVWAYLVMVIEDSDSVHVTLIMCLVVGCTLLFSWSDNNDISVTFNIKF